MANQQQIDKSAQIIADLIDKAKGELINDLYKLGNKIDDIGALATALLDLDVEGTLKAKIKKATSVYANAHRQVLESTIQFANVEGQSLVAFASLNEELFDSAITRTIASNIKTQVTRGVQAGLSADDIITNVGNASISNAQMRTLVNTTLNSYSRAITNQMMNDAPDDTKYAYIGPVDEKTRDECVDMVAADKLTESEIIARFGSAVLVDGGGFNCRHKWEIASTEGTKFHSPKEAQKVQKEIKEKG